MKLTEQQRTWIIASLLVSLLVSVGLGLSRHNSLQRLDLLLYDLILPLQSPAMSDQIVIVAIDDPSINSLGRWPWSRQRHAELIDKLTEMSPRAIGIDILFSEAQIPSDADQSLAKALEDNQRSVLIVAPAQETLDSPITESLPIPLLASSAAALAHVDAELDIDGLSRHFYLYSGLDDPHWPSIALAMLKIGQNDIPALRHFSSSAAIASPTGNGWVRRDKALIPFSHPDEQPKRISYSDILNGNISSDAIQNKYVLIGATSLGIGDMISTPMYHAHEHMHGVELVAQELNGLLQDELLYELSESSQRYLTSILIFICVLAIIILPLRFALLTTLASLFIVLSCSILLLVYQKLWFAPAVTVIMVGSAWPLWNIWQQQVATRLTNTLRAQLAHQTQHHLITGLPNHVALEAQLDQLSSSNANTSMAALLILHINWPQAASSIIGRSLDESILQSIAERLKTAFTSSPLIAHLNGDDFAILITDQKDLATIQRTANDLLAQLHIPFNNNNEDVIIAPHIGISLWPSDGNNSKELLRKAYTAMFKSRMDSQQVVCIYSADLGQEIEARSQLEQAMIHALERNEFKVYYQPQVDAGTGIIIGAEALLRWHNPKLGWISPDSFIPVAEHSGMINLIGDWVLRTACNQLKIIQEEGLEPVRIAVNLSPLQFADDSLVDGIVTILQQAGIPPDNLELEVTESALMNNLDNATQIMEQIKEHGISRAIDDFGTGYSSLQYLQIFPLNRLKIDKCFTQEIGINKNTTAIMLSIIDLAKRLDLTLIAEGVETVEQAEFLRDSGCDELQGYLYSKAVPAKDFMALIRTGINPPI